MIVLIRAGLSFATMTKTRRAVSRALTLTSRAPASAASRTSADDRSSPAPPNLVPNPAADDGASDRADRGEPVRY